MGFAVNQRYRPTAAGVLGSRTPVVLFEAMIEAGCDPGIEGIVAASEYIEKPRVFHS
jgi:hypothetical protein